MPYAPFGDFCPEMAEREFRSITVQEGTDLPLPPGEYGFAEFYCDEQGCDCRRVFFYVISPGSSRPLAVIAWGWEGREFYTRWLHQSDPHMIADLMGPVLNLCSPQSKLAPALLDLVKDVLLKDPDYIDRIKRHYRMFRDKIDEASQSPLPRCLRRKAKKKR